MNKYLKIALPIAGALVIAIIAVLLVRSHRKSAAAVKNTTVPDDPLSHMTGGSGGVPDRQTGNPNIDRPGQPLRPDQMLNKEFLTPQQLDQFNRMNPNFTNGSQTAFNGTGRIVRNRRDGKGRFEKAQ